MRVSKLIRDYITDSVNEKYQPLFDRLDDIHQQDLFKERAEAFRKEMREAFIAQFVKRFGDDYSPEQLSEVTKGISVSLPYYYDSRCKYHMQNAEVCRKLRDRREKDINSILIKLELGGSKEDLDRLLSAVDPVMEEEE